MNIKENVALSAYSTMRLGGNANYLAQVHDKQELSQLMSWANSRGLSTIIIGSGSNIIWPDDGFNGLVIVNRILGFEQTKIDETESYFTIGAGEIWDKIVEQTVSLGFCSIAQLSMIPGTVGGTPVQNVGAYGQEIKNVFVSLEAFDKQLNKYVNLSNDECSFGYRTSRFKTSDKNRFIITSVKLRLSRICQVPPLYKPLQEYLSKNHITSYTPESIRQAVIAIRSNKLPDPTKVANCGSFFSNPIITAEQQIKLVSKFPGIPTWKLSDGKYKVSAAWLIEQAGFPKGYIDSDTGMGLWHKQALVVINDHSSSTHDLLLFKQKLTDTVYNKFELALELEPVLIQNPI